MIDLRFTLADRTARQLGEDELRELLEQPNILRLAFVDERDGAPAVHPVWHYFEGGRFFVATDRDGVKARSLRKNPACYFLVDVDPAGGPPRGARGKARAAVVDDPAYATEVTKRNVLRYIGTLESSAARAIVEMGKSSSVIEISPAYMATWKY